MKIFKILLSLVCIICLTLSACKLKAEDKKEEPVISSGIKYPEANYVDPKDIFITEITPAKISKETEDTLWCYRTLSKTQQSYYKIMLTMVRNLTEGFVSLGFGAEDFASSVAVAYRALMNDFPEYYWFPSSYYLSSDKGNISIAFKKSSIENGYGFEAFQIEENEAEFNDAIYLLASEAEKETDNFEKVKILHDALCKRVDYSTAKDDQTVYSSYGALVNGEAVCEGYSRAFQLLCKSLSINCILVSGNSRNVGHLWNMVEIDGSWYHVDTTWDDLKDEPIYTYLAVTRQQILIDHDIDSDFKTASQSIIAQGHSFNFSLPDCASERLDYFTRNNLFFSYDDVISIAKEIIKRYNNGYSNVQFAFKNENDSELFKDNYKTVIVEIQKEINKNTGNKKIKLKTVFYSRDTCVIEFTKK